MIRYLFLTLGGLLLASAAIAQPAPPPQPGTPTSDQTGPRRLGPPADAPPPPPGPIGERRPPPPRGASIHIERGPDGALRLDVHCAERDPTKDCADIASQILDKVGGMAKAR